mgnify:CR=1 FL=1
MVATTAMQWVKHCLNRDHRTPDAEEAAVFEQIDGHVLGRGECRRSRTLCVEPSLLPDFADTEASCTYSWAQSALGTSMGGR